MKKCIFILLVFCLITVFSVSVVYADTWNGEDYGLGTNNKVFFVCDITPGEVTSNYDLNVSTISDNELNIIGLYVVSSSGVETKWSSGTIFTHDTNFNHRYEANDIVIDNDYDIAYFKIKFMHEADDFSTLYEVNSTMRYEIEPTPIPEPTPTNTPTPTLTNTPTPTSTPTPTPTSTPTPTLTNTPTPTPTNTPIPTPTNTPTPTLSPTPAAILQLDAYVNGSTAVADYFTGGCTPVKSMIEYYEVSTGDILSKLNSETFLSGSGTMKNYMEPGKVYRYKLTYVYKRDGIQYEEFLWSDDLYIADQEIEDYRKSGKITNFRTLMLYTWEEVMDLNIPIDGYDLKVRVLFIWIMIAGLAILFWKKWNGG